VERASLILLPAEAPGIEFTPQAELTGGLVELLLPLLHLTGKSTKTNSTDFALLISTDEYFPG
jgi:hypothetical protein